MATQQEIEDVIKTLEQKTEAGVSRIGVHRVETEREDYVKEVHHHGRCDVGSPLPTEVSEISADEDINDHA